MPTNSILKNRGLGIAIAVSVLIHALVLSVKFVAPTASSFRPVSPVIEVVLGGGGGNGVGSGMGNGNGNTGEPDEKASVVVKKTPETHASMSQRTRNGSREEKLITSLSRQDNQKNIPVPEKKIKNPQKNVRPIDKGNTYAGQGGGRGEGDSVVFNRNARGGYAYGNGSGPAITAQTRDVGDAMYFKTVQKKVENIGVINFPQKNGTRLYGQLTVRINVYYDGSLHGKEGGVAIVRSSGNPALDAAALNIVRRAAPFPRFRGNVRTIVTRLNFTRDQGIRSQVVTTSS